MPSAKQKERGHTESKVSDVQPKENAEEFVSIQLERIELDIRDMDIKDIEIMLTLLPHVTVLLEKEKSLRGMKIGLKT